MYPVRDYSYLFGMPGFSRTLIKDHLTLYRGYVTNTNKLLGTLREMLSTGETNTPEFAELKRRLGWEFDGMRLHEYYFSNLGGDGVFDDCSEIARKITRDFGSYEAWEQDFKAVGSMRGIGWAVLYRDITNNRLINFWINEHDTGHPAGCTPILVMDVFEHAYLRDYGLNRAEYIEAFFNNIDWETVEQRIQ